jgi:hypothetical protein
MKINSHKLNLVDTNFIDKSNVFIEANSPTWRTPMKISLEELLKTIKFEKLEKYDISKNIDENTLIIDPSTLKIKVNFPLLESPNVFCEPFNQHNISYYQPPINASTISSMHMVTDGNYLYIWVENRWKRALLSEWDT